MRNERDHNVPTRKTAFKMGPSFVHAICLAIYTARISCSCLLEPSGHPTESLMLPAMGDTTSRDLSPAVSVSNTIWRLVAHERPRRSTAATFRMASTIRRNTSTVTIFSGIHGRYDDQAAATYSCSVRATDPLIGRSVTPRTGYQLLGAFGSIVSCFVSLV